MRWRRMLKSNLSRLWATVCRPWRPSKALMSAHRPENLADLPLENLADLLPESLAVHRPEPLADLLPESLADLPLEGPRML